MKHDYSVLLDTSFFIRLLNPKDKLHENVKGYYTYFLKNDIILKISTISIAEYCVRGKITDLPLKNLQIIPFNIIHAQQTGQFAAIIFSEKGKSKEDLHPRAIIPNDSKLFAQAHLDHTINYFVTSDTRSKTTLGHLLKRVKLNFEQMDINIPYQQTFKDNSQGELPF